MRRTPRRGSRSKDRPLRPPAGIAESHEGDSYQHDFTALCLGRMLLQERPDAPALVRWECPAISLDPQRSEHVIPVTTGDVLLRLHDGTTVFIEAKSSSRIAEPARLSEPLSGFWKMWRIIPSHTRSKVLMQLVVKSQLPALDQLVRAARHAETLAELRQTAGRAAKLLTAIDSAARLTDEHAAVHFLRAVSSLPCVSPAEELARLLLRTPFQPATKELGAIVRDAFRSGGTPSAYDRVSLIDELRSRGIHLPPSAESRGTGDLVTAIQRHAQAISADMESLYVASGMYVERPDVDSLLEEALGTRLSWVSVIGDSGTGKTSLLVRQYRQLLESSLKPGAPLPLYVDATTLAGRVTAMTPVAGLAGVAAGQRTDTPYGLFEALGQAALAVDRRLVIFLDTIDPVLLTGSDQLLLPWLLEYVKDAPLQVATSCRPLEARLHHLDRLRSVKASLRAATRGQGEETSSGLAHDGPTGSPSHAASLALADFTPDEARRAIAGYVDVHYKDVSKATQIVVRQRLLSYVDSPALRDLVCHPVMLRMVFETYAPGAPPERINRGELFAQYWIRKVRGEGSARQFPVDHDHRAGLVRAVGATMGLGPTLTTWLSRHDIDALCARVPDGAAALQALVSEGVVRLIGEGNSGILTFFHQSMLEYAAARALLEDESPERRERRLEQLLAECLNELDFPRFEILEELALLAEAADHTDPTPRRILQALMESPVQGSIRSAATVWVRLRNPGPLQDLGQRLSTDRDARLALLEQIHNAPVERLADLLGQFAGSGWRNGDGAERLATLDAWGRIAPLYPELVWEQLRNLGVEDSLFEGSLTTSGRWGQEAAKLMSVLSGLLSVAATAETTVASLRRWHDHFSRRLKDDNLRVALVNAAAVRLHTCDQVLGILEDWLCAPDAGGRAHSRELAEALADALSATLHTDAEAQREAALVFVRCTSTDEPAARLRARVLYVWSRRFAAGTLNQAIADRLLRVLDDAERIDTHFAISQSFLEPLATSLNPELFVRLEPRVDETFAPHHTPEPPMPLAQSMALQLLLHYAQADVYARGLSRHASVSSAIATPELCTDAQLFVVAACAYTLDLPHASLARVLGERGLGLTLLRQLRPGRPSAFMLDLLLDAYRDPRTREGGTRAIESWIRQFDKFSEALGPLIGDELIAILESHALADEQALRRAVLQALPRVLRVAGRSDKIAGLFGQLTPKWSLLSIDADAARVGECLAELARLTTIPDQLAGIATAQAERVIGQPIGRSLDNRRQAFNVLDALCASLPQESKRISEAWLVRHESLPELPKELTEDLKGVGRLIYHARHLAPAEAWRMLERLVLLADRAQLGRSGWDAMMPTLTGTIREAIRVQALCGHVASDLPEYVDPLQHEIVRCAMEDANETIYASASAAERQSRLKTRAVGKLRDWARIRRRRTLLEAQAGPAMVG